MSNHPDNRVPFPRPENYDSTQYELLVRIFDAGWREWFQKFDIIPNRKTDTNNHGPFSSDNIGFNYDYPSVSYERRKEIIGWLKATFPNSELEVGQVAREGDAGNARVGGERGADLAAKPVTKMKAAKAAEPAPASFENAVMILPDSSAGYLNRGLALLAAGNPAAAAEPLQRAIDTGAESAEAYIYLGRIYLSSQDRADDALTVLEQGRELFPDNEELQTELLNAYVRAGQTDRAIGAYEARITAEPDNPLYRYNYGSLLLQAERYDEAIEQLEQAIELDAQNANAYYNLGAAYQNKAASFNARIAELEDAGAAQAEVEAVIAERAELLNEALPNLERARALSEGAGEDASSICQALFQVYASLGQEEQAQEAAECAGLDLN